MGPIAANVKLFRLFAKNWRSVSFRLLLVFEPTGVAEGGQAVYLRQRLAE